MRTSTALSLALMSALVAVACAPVQIEPPPPPTVSIRAAPTSPTTYFIRPDGGDYAQCTGLADAPYPGSGTNRPCAWDHPFRALPPEGPPRISGGDTLTVGAGSYQMGFGAPGADVCETDYPWDCHMPPLPSGPDADHPTRLLGAGLGHRLRRPTGALGHRACADRPRPHGQRATSSSPAWRSPTTPAAPRTTQAASPANESATPTAPGLTPVSTRKTLGRHAPRPRHPRPRVPRASEPGASPTGPWRTSA